MQNSSEDRHSTRDYLVAFVNEISEQKQGFLSRNHPIPDSLRPLCRDSFELLEVPRKIPFEGLVGAVKEDYTSNGYEYSPQESRIGEMTATLWFSRGGAKASAQIDYSKEAGHLMVTLCDYNHHDIVEPAAA